MGRNSVLNSACGADKDIWSMCGHSLRSVFYSSPTSAGKDKPVVCSFLTWHTGVALSSINCLDRINRPSALTEVFEGLDLGRSMNFCIKKKKKKKKRKKKKKKKKKGKKGKKRGGKKKKKKKKK